jgi:acyl-CoA synthetase (NDP forming)
MSSPNNLNKLKDISFINNISSMAVIGPSKSRDFFFLRNHQENFQGDLYAIHPTVKRIPNFDDGTQGRVYSSIKDVPEPVDFAFIAVPPKQILSVMRDCREKGVKLVSIFTAEFSDSGTEEGRRLEEKLLEESGGEVRILGPNGMGLFYPKLGIAWRPKFPHQPGNVGFVAQSGGMCNIAIYASQRLGINFSKVFSYGNGADLDFVDLLNFLSEDPETDIILGYIEGIEKERGKVFQRVLSKCKKPLFMLKGGKSEKGSEAVKTHTASVAGSNKIWKALWKQHRVIEINTLEELLHTSRLIDCYGRFHINNLAVLSISGGYGVILVDLIEKYGMKVPHFSANIQSQLNKKFFTLGTSSTNPLDVSAQIYASKAIYEIIDTALSDPKIDGLVMDLPSWYFDLDFHIKKDHSFEPNMIGALSLGHKHKKPILPIIQRVNCPEARERVINKLKKKNVPVFGDPIEFIPLLSKITKSGEK